MRVNVESRYAQTAFPGALPMVGGDQAPLRHRLQLPVLVIAAVLAGACGARSPEPDVPAPASEPRATLRLHVDLPRAQRCEEAFDLALYQDRGIELISWDDGSRCEDRTITVRYLPRRTTPEQVIHEAQETGAKASPLAAPAPAAPETHR